MILINLIRDPSQMGHESKVIDFDHLHHDPSQIKSSILMIMTHLKFGT